ncbi:hypothetical protein A3K88_09210 [Pseudomonas putida]|nr:hypothetical protein A3K88_09210 [Pseudomonas putida]
MHLEAGLIGGRGSELAQVHGLGRVDVQAQFLVQFAHQCLQRRFTRIDLAPRLHEGFGATLAHQQGAPLRVEQQGGGDANGIGHGLNSLATMAGEDPTGSLGLTRPLSRVPARRTAPCQSAHAPP